MAPTATRFLNLSQKETPSPLGERGVINISPRHMLKLRNMCRAHTPLHALWCVGRITSGRFRPRGHLKIHLFVSPTDTLYHGIGSRYRVSSHKFGPTHPTFLGVRGPNHLGPSPLMSHHSVRYPKFMPLCPLAFIFILYTFFILEVL